MPYKILVVDDEKAVRKLFWDLFKKEGYVVTAVASGEEALTTLDKEKFDVVLLDIKLEHMSGIEALKKIKETKPQTTVVMITGFGYDEELVSKSKEFGCSGYISKNLPIAQIMDNFKSFVGKAKDK